MTRRRLAITAAALALLLIAGWLGLALFDTRPGLFDRAGLVPPAPDTGWPAWGNSPGGLRFSPLAQMTPANVKHVREAWRFRIGDAKGFGRTGRPLASFQATPILTGPEAGQSLVFCTAANLVIALDPRNGRQRWRFDPQIDRSHPQPYACRGVAAWEDQMVQSRAPCRTRIFTATQDAVLIALDAVTGRPCRTFGDNGRVRIDPGRPFIVAGEMTFKSPPAIAGDVVVVGSAVRDMMRTGAPSGMVRAFDARSGRPLWQWEPVASRLEDPASGTWPAGQAARHGAANVWGVMAVDPGSGLIFLPTSSPSVDNYGGDRAGANLYGNALVALDGRTGRRRWHFQIVHHDLWDYDLAAQPVLVDLTIAGRRRRAVVQTTKQGLTFVFDRLTGAPLHTIVERPVPPSDVPGERAFRTQPFPTVIPPLGPIGLRPEDAWGPLGLGRASCRAAIGKLRHDDLYTPPSLRGAVAIPTPLGGVNWGGVAIDPRSGVMIVNSSRIAGVLQLVPRRPGSKPVILDPAEVGSEIDISNPQLGTPYESRFKPLMSSYGLPCNAPPWGVLTAIDLGSGRKLWERPFGTTAGRGPALRLGLPSLGGPIITRSGLVFIGAAMDNRFRAYALADGRELWRVKLPAGGQATPMTYAIGGRQFVVIAAGGHFGLRTRPGDYLVAFALPATAIQRSGAL